MITTCNLDKKYILSLEVADFKEELKQLKGKEKKKGRVLVPKELSVS